MLKPEVTRLDGYFQDIIVEKRYNLSVKPKDLKPPPIDRQEGPWIVDGVFFIPKPIPDDCSIAWRQASIEYCSGNGDWIIERALLEPQRFFIAVEMRFDRVRKIWSKMHNRSVKNLLIVCGEAHTFTERFVPADGVDDIYINFPDPWPKRRHAERRLIKAAFLEEVARVMRGELTLATDDQAYFKQTLKLLQNHPSFEGGEREIEGYGTSYFDTLWREKGKEIFYATYGRCASPNDQADLRWADAELFCSST